MVEHSHKIELRRERLSFEHLLDETEDVETDLCLSNRLILPLKTGKNTENIIIRAQTMHLCLRMAEKIALDFNKSGPLINRATKPNWDDMWSKVIHGYEYKWNFNRWIKIYGEGKPLYEKGPGRIPSQLDKLEEIIFNVKENYKMALATFHAKISEELDDVAVNHKSSLALKAEITPQAMRCGMQCRAANNSSIITINADSPKTTHEFDLHNCLGLYADFLQGFQYAFILGHLKKSVKNNKQDKEIQAEIDDITKEIQQINRHIDTAESRCKIRYRPEKPDFELLSAFS